MTRLGDAPILGHVNTDPKITGPDAPSAKLLTTLRAALGLTQARLADLAHVDRIEIIAVEKGRNKASSARMRDGLARAFGLSASVMSKGLEGILAPDDVLKLVRKPARKKAA